VWFKRICCCLQKVSLVFHSTLGVDSEEAKKQAFHFSKLVSNTLSSFEALGIKEVPEVLSYVTGNSEYVLTLGPASQPSDLFFITTKRNEARGINDATQ
jgi:hypothetical protein